MTSDSLDGKSRMKHVDFQHQNKHSYPDTSAIKKFKIYQKTPIWQYICAQFRSEIQNVIGCVSPNINIPLQQKIKKY